MAHPVQDEMIRLEELFDSKGHPPLDACIAQLAGFEDNMKSLDALLNEETERVIRLVRDHYEQILPSRTTIMISRGGVAITPRDKIIATIGFLQGVTFMRAVQNLKS